MALSSNDAGMSLSNDLSNDGSPCEESATKTCSTNEDETKENDDKDKLRLQIKQEATDGKLYSGRSWIDMVEEEKSELLALQVKEEPNFIDPVAELPISDSKMSIEEASSSTSLNEMAKRQIEIDILDSINVQKYDKLVQDDKIKSPFKRRLSGDMDDDEDYGDGHAEFDVEDVYVDEYPHNQHKKTKMHEDDHGRERFRRESSSCGSSSGDGSSLSEGKPVKFENDLAVLERRQKQIDYGKNTLGYENYLNQIPKNQRTKNHPKTPPKHIKYSRRAWDGLVKVWRKKLHCFDPDAKPNADN
ncbi:histone RNA hairpin-binding protein [Toxorhynchites rutilus septentrionalis]|uniref:histone RNA hairpin-binding protein n=1 Tax=Toxorhynchites rutilus septentrionalis TaxID=329112 RepID=UPI00247B0C93|nr:histone RNA hairpin-binding protein [Toxorhynchites rutilus septentrionalis]